MDTYRKQHRGGVGIKGAAPERWRFLGAYLRCDRTSEHLIFHRLGQMLYVESPPNP